MISNCCIWIHLLHYFLPIFSSFFIFNPDIINPFFSREPTSLQAITENQDQFQLDKQVSFSDLRHTNVSYASKPMTAPSSGFVSGLGQSEDLNLHRNATFTSIGSRQTGGRNLTTAENSRAVTSSRSLAHIGRPIAQVSKVPDPVSV